MYAGGLTPIAELDSADNVIKRFAASYIIKNDTTYRVVTNHLGSVRMIVNTVSGEVVQKIDYDEYSNIINVLLIDEFLDFTYAGGLYDADTKLIRFGARDYNAEIGRWTSKDPIGFNGSFSNLYEYVKNDPINRIDLTGLQDLSNPWTIGLEWLTGLGPRSHHFADGDPFTEQLRQHQHIRDLIKGICEGTLPQQGKFDYNLGGVQGVGKYIRDYSTLLTGGLTGNLAVTYLGSYNLNYTVNNGIVNINVNNPSTISSATHPPIIGYTDFWNKYIGNPLDELFSSGPMSKTTQSFNFHEKLKGDCDCK